MLKRIFSIIGAILILCVTGAIVIGALTYTGIIDWDRAQGQHVFEYTTEDGYKYTERDWEWSPVEYKKKINYVDVTGVATRTVNMHLTGDTYYTITIPDVDYIYDYGKTLWASDGTYMIRVVGEATLTNLASLAGIDNGDSITQTTLCTREDVKGARTIVTLIDSYAIIVDVYSGDTVYSILRDSLANNKMSTTITECTYTDDYLELEKLTYTGDYVAQVVFQDISLVQEKYLFAEGSLWVSSDLDNYVRLEDTYLKLLCEASSTSISRTYKADGMFYAAAGDYSLGLISYNSNTTIVLLGDGEEAKCNIISIMNYLK